MIRRSFLKNLAGALVSAYVPLADVFAPGLTGPFAFRDPEEMYFKLEVSITKDGETRALTREYEMVGVPSHVALARVEQGDTGGWIIKSVS